VTKTLIPCYLSKCRGPAYLYEALDIFAGSLRFWGKCDDCGGVTLRRKTAEHALKDWYDFTKVSHYMVMILTEVPL
jgi:hypothetical protein